MKDKGDRKKKKSEVKEEKPQVDFPGEILSSGAIPHDENAMDGITIKEEITSGLPLDTTLVALLLEILNCLHHYTI